MTDCMEITVSSAEETFGIGEALGRALEPGSVVALTGELGAGKTVIAKGIAKGVGIEEEPTSPTFVIMNVYEVNEKGDGGERKALKRGIKRLYHLDLYRISGLEELEGIGYEDYFFDDEAVVVVEWAERVKGIFPPSAIHIEIEIPAQGGGDKKRGSKEAGNDVEGDSGVVDNGIVGSAEIGIITKRTIKIMGEEDWLLSFKSMVERA